MVQSCAGTFLMPCLVNGRTLCYAIIVTLPDDIGVGRKGKEALDGLTDSQLASADDQRRDERTES